MPTTTPPTAKTLLIIEQGFLKPRRAKPVHGVEIFRLHLIRQLAQRGIRVTIVAENSWKKIFDERLPNLPISFIFAPPFLGVAGAGLLAAIRAAKSTRKNGPFDLLLLGNARLGLVPAMHWAAWFNLARRTLLFAHRDPGANFLDAVSTLSFDLLANSQWVADWYRGHTSGSVDVLYGLPNAERFHPPNTPPDSNPDRPINFVLLGRLPNISKGQEKAVAAFNALPPTLRARCRLHLASFASPPDTGDPAIIAHPWMTADAIPDFLRSMDIMLALSSHETFSQAIVQGMLTALPIVASDIPVFLEKIDPAQGGAGGVITRNVAEATAAMTRLALDPDLRAHIGAQGRTLALQRYIWDTDEFIRRYLA